MGWWGVPPYGVSCLLLPLMAFLVWAGLDRCVSAHTEYQAQPYWCILGVRIEPCTLQLLLSVELGVCQDFEGRRCDARKAPYCLSVLCYPAIWQPSIDVALSSMEQHWSNEGRMKVTNLFHLECFLDLCCGCIVLELCTWFTFAWILLLFKFWHHLTMHDIDIISRFLCY